MSPATRCRIKIVGVGHEWRSDDAAGLLVVRLVKEMGLSTATVLESGGDPADLLEIWRDGGTVIIADAVVSGAPPGRIHRFEAKGRALPLHFGAPCSTHFWGLAEALALASVFQELPEHLIVYGVEVRNFTMGQELTPEVKSALPEVARLIREEVKRLEREARARGVP